MFFLLLSDGSNFRVHFFYVSDARGARWGPRLRDSSVFPRLYSGLPPWAKNNSAGTIFRNPSTVPTQSEFTHMLLKGVSCPRDLAKSEKRPYCFGGGGVLFGC